MHPRAHVRRMLTLLGAGIVVAFAAQRVLQPKSFGERGHYRADSLFEIAQREPVHLGRAACADCHVDIDVVHQKDVHWRVQCEDCHGPGDVHARYHRDHPEIDGGVDPHSDTGVPPVNSPAGRRCHYPRIA